MADNTQYPGQPNPGQPYTAQPPAGQQYPAQSVPGETYPAQPVAGQPGAGQPFPGQPVAGQPFPGQPVTGGAPARPRGKRIALIAAGAVVACAGLCGIGQLITNIVNKDDWEGKGQPVPASTLAATPTPTWKPPSMFGKDPQPAAQIRHQLESWVLTSAGVAKPMTSTCDQPGFTGQIATTLTCTVTYDGQKVVYTVTTRPKGSSLFEWEAKAPQMVVTREGLLALMHRRFGQGENRWEDLRCEEFPAVALVPVGESMSQSCYGKHDGAAKTVKIKIRASDKGEPQIDTERQD